MRVAICDGIAFLGVASPYAEHLHVKLVLYYDKPCKELFVSEMLSSFDLGTPAALDAYYKPLLLHLPDSVSEAEPLRSDDDE